MVSHVAFIHNVHPKITLRVNDYWQKPSMMFQMFEMAKRLFGRIWQSQRHVISGRIAWPMKRINSKELTTSDIEVYNGLIYGKERDMMAEIKVPHSVLILLILALGLAMINKESSKALSQETNPETFKILKEKSINPETGLPKTLDPSLFKGKAKEAYQIAKVVPEILAHMPCFCECEAF